MFTDQKTIDRLVGALREAVHSGRELRTIQVNHKGLRSNNLSLYKEKYVAETDLKDIAESVFRKCQDDADTLGGKQQYILVFFFDKSTKFELGCRFACTGQSYDEEGYFDGSEPATRRGQHAQIMRHNEGMFDTTIKATQGMMRGQATLLDKAYKRIDELERRLDEVMDKNRELMNARHEQEMERLIMEKREDRRDEIMEIVKTLAFPVVNKISGVKLLPESEEGGAVSALLDTLDMEQMGKLQGILKPHQMAMVMSMMQEHLNKDEEDKPKQLTSGGKR